MENNKRWCICDYVILGYIEKEEDDGCLWIRYSENQVYGLQAWDPLYVERFETWREALAAFTKRVILRHYSCPEEYVTDSFPTYAKED